jgi:S-methylmethionine-dependent homocysteine/selenocysteine methylase
MTRTTTRLPQLQGGLFLTDGGLETTLIFHEGLDLPHFAAFPLLKDARGRQTLTRYFERYIALARQHGTGFILESPTWRASADWGRLLGYDEAAMAEVNEESIALMKELRWSHQSARLPIVVSGCIGPRGDGYVADAALTPDAAAGYHALQAGAFARAGADMVTAITMTNAAEAVGVARAAADVGLPAAISFTVETDGRLPSGQSLRDAIAEVEVATRSGVAYYMVNCAHPSHFESTLKEDEAWTALIRGVRANASRRSHQELNDSPDLDDGNPGELGREHAALLRRFPSISVLGGCCGTDHRHVGAIAAACTHVADAA